jgi:hypothetical protein
MNPSVRGTARFPGHFDSQYLVIAIIVARESAAGNAGNSQIVPGKMSFF